MDFGGRWDIRFFRQLPPMATWPLLAAASAGRATAVATRVNKRLLLGWDGDGLWLYLHLELLCFSLLFFFVGGYLSDARATSQRNT